MIRSSAGNMGHLGMILLAYIISQMIHSWCDDCTLLLGWPLATSSIDHNSDAAFSFYNLWTEHLRFFFETTVDKIQWQWPWQQREWRRYCVIRLFLRSEPCREYYRIHRQHGIFWLGPWSLARTRWVIPIIVRFNPKSSLSEQLDSHYHPICCIR